MRGASVCVVLCRDRFARVGVIGRMPLKHNVIIIHIQ
jgi:hypothetical protein